MSKYFKCLKHLATWSEIGYLLCPMREALRGLGQFLLSIAPAIGYVILYDLSRHLPTAVRPAIDAEILVRWELALFGGFPHRWLDDHHTPLLDILAAIPYQFHFIVPLVFAGFLWLRHRPLLAQFAWTYAAMNLAWMLTALFILPTTPPWYYEQFGLAPANYAMSGDAAALLRVDGLLGIPLFENIYRQSAMVFAAFPSMHAAWPTLVALFSRRLIRPWTLVLLWLYTAWVWWAAIYLQHHYVVDIIGGILYALAVFYAVQIFWRARPVQKKKPSPISQRGLHIKSGDVLLSHG